MGEFLARQIIDARPAHGIDVVIPIPDTARTCALQAAYTLGVPYREGFIKNRYIARTFIMPGQVQRRKSVRLKLNTIKAEVSARARACERERARACERETASERPRRERLERAISSRAVGTRSWRRLSGSPQTTREPAEP
jgi:hypothetical protein